MAIVLEANYTKKIGLPGYSSHQHSLTVRVELSDLSQVEAESKRLYDLLQANVDRGIQQPGFLPQNNGYRSAGHGNGRNGHGNGAGEAWKCSDRQRELILKIVDENNLDKAEVEKLAQERFGKAVRDLNKLDASGLIEELIAQTVNGNGGRNRLQKAGAK